VAASCPLVLMFSIRHNPDLGDGAGE